MSKSNRLLATEGRAKMICQPKIKIGLKTIGVTKRSNSDQKVGADKKTNLDPTPRSDANPFPHAQPPYHPTGGHMAINIGGGGGGGEGRVEETRSRRR